MPIPTSGSGRLPRVLTRYFGRQAETAELEGLLDQARVVTLTGAPGCGKTRLAVEFAALVEARFSDGVTFVELATISHPAQVSSAIAAALGIREEASRVTEDTIVEALGPAELLIVLDNCEHVVDAVAPIVLQLTAAAPAVRVLATSRVPLGLSGEQIWTVPPLDTTWAVELFNDRAGLVAGRAAPAGDARVEEICRRLDGLPLAIELVAAFTRVLSVDQIVARLDDALPLLSSGARDATYRQETMEATVEWSYRLLDPAEQALFDRVSVFAGGFDLTAVGAVADGPPDVDALEGLTTLVDHSLVVAETAGEGPMRYHVLEPIRQCGERGLLHRGEREALRQQHAEHYLAIARRADGDVRSGDPARGLDRLDVDHANLLAALDWARGRCADLGLQLCCALARFWERRGLVNEGREWFEDLLTLATEDERLRATALARAGRLAWRQRDYAQATAWLHDGIAISRRLGDELAVARRLRSLALVAMSQGDAEPAIDLCRQSIAIFRAHDDERSRMWALIYLGWACYVAGDLGAGDEHMDEALGIGRTAGDLRAAADAHLGMSYSAQLNGDATRTRGHFVDAIAALRASGGIVEEPDWVWGGAALAACESRWRAVLRLAGGAEGLSRHAGSYMNEQFMGPLEPLLARARDAVGRSVADRLTADGARLSLDQLVAEALAEPGSEPEDPLTRREHDVVELVAQGLTNVEIGQHLFISKRTVESHIEHVKQKLSLQTRPQIMAWGLDRYAPSPDP